MTAAFSPDAGAHRALKARGGRDQIQDGALAGEGRVRGQGPRTGGLRGGFCTPRGGSCDRDQNPQALAQVTALPRVSCVSVRSSLNS